METSPTIKILLMCATRDGMLVRSAILREAGYDVSASFPLETALTFDGSIFPIGIIVSDRVDVNLIRTVRERFKGIRIILISGFVDELGLTPASTGTDDVIKKACGERKDLLRAIRKLLKPPKRPLDKRVPVKTRRLAVA